MATQTMNDHPLRRCGNDGAAHGDGSALLPASPFYAPRYHFGMLLGVDDFEAEQAYHRGKGLLHNSWLHREGVVWGLGVELTRRGITTGELRVLPGLALDAAGRELHLDEPVCLGLPSWYETHRREVKAWHDAHRHEIEEWLEKHARERREPYGGGHDRAAEPYAGREHEAERPYAEREHEAERPYGAGEDEARTYGGGGWGHPTPAGVVRFWAHVVARFAACEARPVPALGEPCPEGGGSEVACSRTQEHVELYLVPGLPQRQRRPYHRLRLLFGITEPRRDPLGAITDDDQEVIDARQAVLARPAPEQPRAYLRWFRRFAALDELDLVPGTLPDGRACLAPACDGSDRAAVVLAALDVTLKPGKQGKLVFAGAAVDNTVRPSHVATSTLQELLCGPIAGGPAPHDAGGPRILRHSVRAQERRIAMCADRDLARGSVRPEAFSVSSYNERGGWHDVDVNVTRLEKDQRTIHLRLASGLGGFLVRVRARGTGTSPLLGTTLVPLAGGEHSPPGTRDDGHDFVAMLNLAAPQRRNT